MKVLRFIPAILGLLLLGCSAPKQGGDALFTEKQSFNENWAFSKGDFSDAKALSFDDSKWRKLDLPHDWAIEGPFDSKYNARAGGLPYHGVAWYRKTFKVPVAQEGKKVFVAFEGAMSIAKVWVNGKFAGERPYGYIGFQLDVTPFLNETGKENVVAVKLAPEDFSSRWYPGAGIYRDVWISYENNVHVAYNGTFITTSDVSKKKATVNVLTEVQNEAETPAKVIVETHIMDNSDKEILVNSKSIEIAKQTTQNINLFFDINNPDLWDLNQPNLYKAVTVIRKGSQVLDKEETIFGIRDIQFSADKGFELNGKRVQLNGVCLHHDQGPLGAAVNRRAKQRQLQIMKEMGTNAIRTSHNPPSRTLLELCDELGLVVIDEAFDCWKLPKIENGYNKYFDEWSEKDLRDMIRRDRNHPSIIMWSIGNEILEQSRKDGWKQARRLAQITKSEDTTRPVTAGFNHYPASVNNKLANEIDIVGFNYKPMNYGEVLEANPNWIVYGSETSSCTSSRGVYHLPIEKYQKHESMQVTSYDIIGPVWAYPPDIEFSQLEKNPKILGEFIWTGFDYLGEPTPYGGRDNSTNGYWNGDWPSHASYFGAADLCGFPKDRYYLYQSQWSEKPMVHVLPHWNWEGKEGETIPVYAYSNCDEVELFVNGKSMGKRVKGVDKTPVKVKFKVWNKKTKKREWFEKDFMSKYRLGWNVPYQKGTIKVVAYKAGKMVAEKEVKTAGKPYAVALSADRPTIMADGRDLSYVTVKIVDKDGNICPNAGNLVNFEVEGNGKIAGVGNGNSASLTNLQGDKMEAFSGMALLIVQSDKVNNGTIKIKATSKDLQTAELSVKQANQVL